VEQDGEEQPPGLGAQRSVGQLRQVVVEASLVGPDRLVDERDGEAFKVSAFAPRVGLTPRPEDGILAAH
jgi:hypothetical protein